MPKVKITGEVYKFVDEETGLFWSGQRTGGFSAEGVTFHTLEKANSAWEKYEVVRHRKPIGQVLPELTRLTYQVSLTEKDRQKFDVDGPGFRVALMKELHDPRVGQFVERLAELPNFMDFKYVLWREVRKDTLFLDLSTTPSAVLSSRATKRRFIGLCTETDLIYLRMQLGEDLRKIYDLTTGQLTYSKDRL